MDDFRRRPATPLDVNTRPIRKPGHRTAPPSLNGAHSATIASSAQPETQAPTPPSPDPSSLPTPQPISDPLENKGRRPHKKRRALWWMVVSLLTVIVALLVSTALWFSAQLKPVDDTDTTKKTIAVVQGSLPATIAQQLEDEKVIRNATVFLWYAKATGVQNKLQAGTYRLSPSESTPEIIDHLVSGRVDTFRVTFLPGATVADNKKVLEDVGYTKAEVDAAFAASYDSPLFASKPASADLEGYIYGDTYEFATDASVAQVLERTFEEFYAVVQEHKLTEAFKAQGLTLYEGITLASIIQREASPGGDDMPQIAQVFYKRLSIDMPLGSDVTYQYIADKTGQTRSPTLDSPYNTRKYPGLPPGPIAAPGEKALLAVANPASGDYLYFLSGDDDVTYFARTLEEHEANIKNHCQEKCQII